MTLNSCACRSRVRPNDGADADDQPDDGERACPARAPSRARAAARRRAPCECRSPSGAGSPSTTGCRRCRSPPARAPARRTSPAAAPGSAAATTVSANTSSIVRSLTIGSVGSIARTTLPDRPAASDSNGSAERTTMFMLRGAELAMRGPCSARKYSSVPVFCATPPCFTSRTTPTIVNHGELRAEPGLQPAADRALIAEERLRQRLVDERDRRTAGDVGRREVAAVHERDPHRRQVRRRHGLVVVDVLERAVGRRACSPRSRCRSRSPGAAAAGPSSPRRPARRAALPAAPVSRAKKSTTLCGV